jgi:hypothetical protein
MLYKAALRAELTARLSVSWTQVDDNGTRRVGWCRRPAASRPALSLVNRYYDPAFGKSVDRVARPSGRACAYSVKVLQYLGSTGSEVVVTRGVTA